MSEQIVPSPRADAKHDARDTATLSELFDKAFELFNEINRTNELTNCLKVQCDVKRAMHMFEDATKLVSIVDMFSENETFDEVSTENVKYFLLPALLGTLAMKLCNMDERRHIVSVAEIYFVDFLKRVKAYGLTDANVPDIQSDRETEHEPEHEPERTRSNAEAITEMVSRRNTKLQRYKEQKELESRLENLKKKLSNPNIDDEIKREYFVTLIKLYVNLSLEELSLLPTEKLVLEHMKNTGKIERHASHASRKLKPSTTKLQPIIITRDEVQKKVYGAGYPSLPVLTVQEFYDQRVRDGDWPGPSQQDKGKCLQDIANASGNDAEQEDVKREESIETDDTATLKQLRAMDEYKDTHRRGWGNRANRS